MATTSRVKIRSSEEGALVVGSPFLPTEDWYTTSDAAAIDSDARFVLGDRLDRIVKIEAEESVATGGRGTLRAHQWIADAVAIPLTKHRHCVGAVLVLEAGGEEQHKLLGRQKFIQALRTELVQHLPAVAILETGV
ncbi:MAG: hypothetical protein IPG64_11490 [Haliea sp.]|nr:hypothetical protein [Haliea sp.]